MPNLGKLNAIIGRKTTILNDFKNMSLLYGFDNPNFFTVDGSNNLATVKDRGPIDVTFTKTGSLAYDSSKKSIKLTSSALLSHTRASFLKGNTLVVLAFRQKYDFTNWNGSLATYRLIYDGATAYHTAYINSASYQDTMFNALATDAYRLKPVYEIGGHTIVMLMTDGANLYFYVNNVLKYTKSFTGSASDIRGITALIFAATELPASSEVNLHEVRVYNKIYSAPERLTLYNDIISRFNLDVTNYPTASILAINGTVRAGETVTLSYTYNQNGASAAGDFFVIWGWYYNALSVGGGHDPAEYSWGNVIVTAAKKNDLTAVVPSQPAGYHFFAHLIVYDDQNRTSKTVYKVSAPIVT